MQIVKQLQDGVGTYFTRQICFLACHYQLFEQLPPEKQGKYLNRSLLSDKQVQTAARTYLTSLPTGEVTPSRFCHMLNGQILPLQLHPQRWAVRTHSLAMACEVGLEEQAAAERGLHGWS